MVGERCRTKPNRGLPFLGEAATGFFGFSLFSFCGERLVLSVAEGSRTIEPDFFLLRDETDPDTRVGINSLPLVPETGFLPDKTSALSLDTTFLSVAGTSPLLSSKGGKRSIFFILCAKH